MDGSDDEQFPHGTVRLEQLLDAGDNRIILQPTPSPDPNDPLNWSKLWKTVNFSLVCLYTLLVFVNVDVGTVDYQQLYDELDIGFDQEQVAYGLNTLGLAVGSILFIPFALKYGRRPVYILSIIVSIAGAVWQGTTQTAGDLYGSNLIAGLAGSVAEVICQMTIADLFFVHQRATANSIYLVMVSMGAYLGPVAAGYVAESQGWRWIFWWTTIIGAVNLVLYIFFYEETKYDPTTEAPVVTAPAVVSSLFTRTQTPDSTRNLIGKPRDGANAESGRTNTDLSTNTNTSITRRRPYLRRLFHTSSSHGDWLTFIRHSWQGFHILFTIPIIAWITFMSSALFALFAIVNQTFSIYFVLDPYNFTPSGIGLMNLPPFIGGILGSLYGGWLNDWLIRQLARRNKGIYEPEMRLWLALPSIILMPGSLLLFGLSTNYGLPWIIPCVGLAMNGFAYVSLSNCLLTYLMDSYIEIIGDTMVQFAFVRNAFATIVVVAMDPWTDAMGLDGIYIICASVSFVLCATIIPVYFYGKRMRIKSGPRYEKMSKRQYTTRA
ncbi:Hypothetical protein R9X50_00643700 [Acrodontium crateriforme]|uniref:Major facilitator superfamily (MFS) profile domain-containing protein n=1 Tax=Acrodontium crateriforme TaxID=150365 RepID=A0AAQ3RBK2_9PEZI|nr:Hypothetical protein R9X50_00643700 [Acrodontium crateriforme]